jgi:peptide deformylase
VERPTSIRVLNHTPAGDAVELELSGPLARIVQHELDHLDGGLYTDHVPRGQSLTFTDPETRARNAARLAGLS